VRPRIATLLWVDCTAAAVVGVAMLALSGLLAPWFGLPRGLLVFTGIANLVYGSFSFSLARSPAPPRRLVWLLVAANFSWTAVCAVLAAAFAHPGSALGVAWLLLEGLVVGALAAVEAVALRASGEG
jgi:predicted membrane-bound spermidine synthase